MQTVYLDRSGIQCQREGKTLVLRNAEGERLGTLPTRNIERLIIQGEATFSTGALADLLEAGASIVCLSKRNSRRTASVLGPLPADAALRIHQYQAYQSGAFRLSVARRIVRAKLQGQLRTVQLWQGQYRPDHRLLQNAQNHLQQALDHLDQVADLDSLLGQEGQAARAYFAALFSRVPPAVSSTARSRRPPKDPINVLLSLGYTLAQQESIAAAYGAGLDPYIGFLHELLFGRESLACDLTEFLRSMVDEFTVQLLQEGTLRPEDFSLSGGACQLGKAGRSRYYREFSRLGPRLRRWARRYARWMAASIRTVELP